MLSRLKLSTDGRSRIARTTRKKISSLAALNFLRDCPEHILKVDKSAKNVDNKRKTATDVPTAQKKIKNCTAVFSCMRKAGPKPKKTITVVGLE